MAEDSKERPSSSKSPSDEEKKPQQPAPTTPQPAPKPATTQQAPAATPVPPRPAVAVPPRPVAMPPPIPPSRPKDTSRRGFLKILVAIAAVLSVVPFVPWGDYLSHSLSSSGAAERQKVVIDNTSKYGAAAGKVVNVSDMTTFPPDSHWVITFPSSGDPTLDAQNPDTFVKFELIRLPAGQLGGDKAVAAAFVAFSKVCVHLWCSPNYNPLASNEDYECPCHGSIYEIPDGKAVQGPASEQPPPTNAIPMLTLTSDSSGDLWIEKPLWDVDHNGVIGYGRNYESYYSYIKTATPPSGSS